MSREEDDFFAIETEFAIDMSEYFSDIRDLHASNMSLETLMTLCKAMYVSGFGSGMQHAVSLIKGEVEKQAGKKLK